MPGPHLWADFSNIILRMDHHRRRIDWNISLLHWNWVELTFSLLLVFSLCISKSYNNTKYISVGLTVSNLQLILIHTWEHAVGHSLLPWCSLLMLVITKRRQGNPLIEDLKFGFIFNIVLLLQNQSDLQQSFPYYLSFLYLLNLDCDFTGFEIWQVSH
jgi:hypothetical protein